MLEYKGYTAQVELDTEAAIFHGEVLDTRDVITFQEKSVDEVQEAFRKSVDDYLEFCAQRGGGTEKPFSGRLMVRLSPNLHRKLYVQAKEEGKSLIEQGRIVYVRISDRLRRSSRPLKQPRKCNRGFGHLSVITRRVPDEQAKGREIMPPAVDYFCTKESNEQNALVSNYGYKFQKTICKLPDKSSDTVPLYRFRHKFGNHFYHTSDTPPIAEAVLEATAGYVYTQGGPGRFAIKGIYHADSGIYCYGTQDSDFTSLKAPSDSYGDWGTVGYGLPSIGHVGTAFNRYKLDVSKFDRPFRKLKVHLRRVHTLANEKAMRDTAVAAMKSAGVQLEFASESALTPPQGVNWLSFATSSFTNASAAMKELLTQRGGAGAETVIYTVKSFEDGATGATFGHIPAIVITANAAGNTLAHELGHLLRLTHVKDGNRLMHGVDKTRTGTLLVETEVNILHQSTLLSPA